MRIMLMIVLEVIVKIGCIKTLDLLSNDEVLLLYLLIKKENFKIFFEKVILLL